MDSNRHCLCTHLSFKGCKSFTSPLLLLLLLSIPFPFTEPVSQFSMYRYSAHRYTFKEGAKDTNQHHQLANKEEEEGEEEGEEGGRQEEGEGEKER